MRFQALRQSFIAPAALVAIAVSACQEEAESPTSPESPPAAAAETVAALPAFTFLAAGGSHTCALDATGAAWCWGENSDGQLGLGYGNGSSQLTPARVTGNLKFVQISAGSRTTCGITTQNLAYCWGAGPLSYVPVAVPGGHHFRTVITGNEHTCAVTPGNIAFCWGSGHWGELGTGHSQFSDVPVRVFGGLRWRRVYAGGQATCGVTLDDVAYCWGYLLGGKQPTKVAGGLHFRQVWVGGGDYSDAQHEEPDLPHACGITPDNKAYCWGSGFEGELGGDATSRTTPVAVSGGRSWRQVVAGHYHPCGITQAEVAFCWGLNQWGANGNGTLQGSNVPGRVNGGLSFASISTGVLGLHTCGLTDAGKIYCWGYNVSGELGDGTRTQRLTPVAVVAGN